MSHRHKMVSIQQKDSIQKNTEFLKQDTFTAELAKQRR